MRTPLRVAFLTCLLAAPSLAQDAPPAPPPAPPAEAAEARAFWTPAELAQIDAGLHLVNCTRKDLAFQKQPIDDPFRLSVVRRSLDDPLSVGAEADAWDAVVRRGVASEIVGAARDATDVQSFRSPPNPPAPWDRPAGVPVALMEWIEQTLAVVVADAGPATAQQLHSFGKEMPSFVKKARATQIERPEVTIDAPDMADADFLAKAKGLHRASMFERSSAAVAEVERLVAALRASDWSPAPGEPIRATSPDGEIAIYGRGDDVHPADETAVLVIDLGGNDTWMRGAWADVLANRPAAIAIDLAGDDLYVGAHDLSFGAALGGFAIQWDAAGNDTYRAGSLSCGAAILGVGVLVDEGGDDLFRVKDFGLGAGAFGVGVLLKRGGNDSYHADLFGQGFASTWGCGVLADLGGNDVYDAGGAHLHAPLYRDRYQALSQGFSIGMRPDASGGVGVLVDVSGNDRYATDIYGQGSSYWYSLGLLIDDEGHDTYAGVHYCQGTGIHLSAGMLLDRAGNDSYYTLNGVGVGGAHDYAVGFLVDRAGDDHYAGSGGSQGGALTNSVAILLDAAGDDGYTAVRGGSQGSASPARGTGGIGLMLDGGGADVYSEKTRDAAAWTRDFYGAGIDAPSAELAGGDPQAAAITQEAAEARVAAEGMAPTGGAGPVWDLDRLWKLASQWEVNDNRIVVPIARARLWDLGAPALARALERIATKDGLEFRAVESTCAKFRDEAVPLLVVKTSDADPLVRGGAVRVLTTLKAPEAFDRFAVLLDTDEPNRGAVLAGLAALKKAPPAVAALLRAPKERVGVQAALCLGGVGDAEAIAALVGAIGPETAFPVRIAAVEQLGALGDAAVPALAEVAIGGAGASMKRRNALRALGKTGRAGAITAVTACLTDADRGVRLSALEAARDLDGKLEGEAKTALAAAVAAARAAETDADLRRWR
jgi:HEAT repeat protein